MSERLVRPRPWVAILCVVGVFIGAAALVQLPDPFKTAGEDARMLKFLLTAWVLAGALAAASLFRLAAWTTFRLTPTALIRYGLFGSRTFPWRDLVSVTRNDRVIAFRFKRGHVRILVAHFAPADIAAVAAAATTPA